MSKHERRSNQTIQDILTSAEKLFSKKGYDAVTIREIAKDAGCSHTTIYLYFKDKEALLHQLAMPVLETLHQQLKQLSTQEDMSAIARLKNISRAYILFGLQNQNMYSVLINAKSTKVDQEHPELEVNKLRIEIFEILMEVIQQCLSIPNGKQLLAFSRIFYYNLNGVLMTYSYMHEPLETLMERLTSTFDLSVDILILGFKEKLSEE
ncbi:TetR/AcrR family transcriptional regulator [Amphibacillus sp. Q70]|uniref:TetR/AcrR family transcriptional regulator n=1 Tax=Amphibacillus sp. Q70 TaxID=3453416 RepID=UPI003F87FB0A